MSVCSPSHVLFQVPVVLSVLNVVSDSLPTVSVIKISNALHPVPCYTISAVQAQDRWLLCWACGFEAPKARQRLQGGPGQTVRNIERKPQTCAPNRPPRSELKYQLIHVFVAKIIEQKKNFILKSGCSHRRDGENAALSSQLKRCE